MRVLKTLPFWGPDSNSGGCNFIELRLTCLLFLEINHITDFTLLYDFFLHGKTILSQNFCKSGTNLIAFLFDQKPSSFKNLYNLILLLCTK